MDNRRRQRFVEKNGDIFFKQIHLEDRHRYLKDLFTSLLDLSWTWILILFLICFIFSWLLFASIWYLIMLINGDFSSERWILSSEDRENLSCLKGVQSYWGTILFSIETQQTIGYGTRSINENCSLAIIFLIIQSCFGLLIQSLWVGLVYTRLSRPRKRRQTLIWSRQGVISFENPWKIFQIRLADMRQRSTLVEPHIRMYCISQSSVNQNEINSIDFKLIDMNCGFNDGKDRIVLNWPLIIEHRIDEQSPFYQMDFQQFYRSNLEIFVILEGIIESTGMVTQAKTSYLTSEILWDHQFQSMMSLDSNQSLIIDYNRFHQTKPLSSSLSSHLSPQQFYSQQQQINN